MDLHENINLTAILSAQNMIHAFRRDSAGRPEETRRTQKMNPSN
jgi:YD repeat-containing protein